MYDDEFLTFDKAREFAHSLGLKKISDWENYCNSGKKPHNLPHNPAVYYWEEWRGWKDWFVDTDIDTLEAESKKIEKDLIDESQISAKDKNPHYLPFDQARDYIHSLKLKTEGDWWDYASSGSKPSNIPLTPWKAYGNQWEGFEDWLGIEKTKQTSSHFLSFEQAREYVSTLGLKSHKDWMVFSRSGKRPLNIPSTPHHKYKEKWKSWGDWLGTGRIDPKKIEYLPFEEARNFVRKLQLKNHTQWTNFCKSGNKPQNIPRYPQTKYPKEWKGWRDWFKDSGMNNIIIDSSTLEDETIKNLDVAINDLSSKYLSFDQAREYTRSLELRNVNEWKKFITSGKRPLNIPSTPHHKYKEKWKSWGDWLGIDDFEANQFLPFEQAREYVKSLGLKGYKEWKKFCISGKRPSNIPSNPYLTYREKWIGYGDWLGTGRTKATNSQNSSPFEEARKYVRSLNISNQKEWKEFCRSGKKPRDIPVNPSKVYWKEWMGWADWFGQVFLQFKEARDVVRMLKLSNSTEWEKFCKSGNKPPNIPEDPWRVYSMQWKNMDDWLKFGKNNPVKIEYLPFEEARKYVRSLKLEHSWYGFCISGRKPRNIPPNPEGTYPDKWRGWDDWLGIK